MVKNVLLDVDGVIWHGGKLIEGTKQTIAFLEKNNYNYLFLTNISRYTAKELTVRLKKLGLTVPVEKILSPLEITIQFIKNKKKNASCFVISEPAIKEQFKEAGLKIVENDSKADFVIVFLYEKTNYDMLDTAFRLLSKGAELVSNSDLKSIAFRDNFPSIATGAFVKALEYSSGKKATLTGKPNTEFFLQAIKKLGAKRSETLMVGDTVSTDVVGAKRSGIKAVLVKTGNFDKKELKKSVLKPDAVIDSIAELPKILQKMVKK